MAEATDTKAKRPAQDSTKVKAKTAAKPLAKLPPQGEVAVPEVSQAEGAEAPKSPAAWAYERLVRYIRSFEQQLDATQEIAMGFAGSDAGVLRIEGLGYYDPDIVTFYGRDESGMKTQLIQHVTQLSVILRAAPKEQPQEPPRRIGFALNTGWNGGESGDASA
ncbi:DUF6173 family protein [Xinfangfangia sp. CPCC 101601]|uniref:DUF6173 family protein n=1 Tax=Pseudogemmobacter lacusdianii TaxID=3069608 RepID=A0ABU0VXS7_9RHOB|nr:DUF6173 family protein [Xinfangfangia sp. CPCC 101601]MDQ2066313.1 DUF6173 family protein [Xinfangfangia sp. CPCC 101601]